MTPIRRDCIVPLVTSQLRDTERDRAVELTPRRHVPANFLAEMARTGQPIRMVAQGLQVSERQITRWRGGQIPRYGFVERMAAYFGRSVEWFMADHSDDPHGWKDAA